MIETRDRAPAGASLAVPDRAAARPETRPRGAAEFDWLWVGGLALAITLGIGSRPISGQRLWLLYILLGSVLPGLALALVVVERRWPGVGAARWVRTAFTLLALAGMLLLSFRDMGGRLAVLYLLVGIGLIGLALARRLVERRRPALAGLARRVQVALSLAMVGATLVHGIGRSDVLAVLAAVVQAPAILWLLRSRTGRAAPWIGWGDLPRLVAWTIVGLAAWLAATTMVAWEPAGMVASLYLTAVFLLAAYAVLSSLWREQPGRWSSRLPTVAALLLLALAGLHNSLLFGAGTHTHWSFYVGPAQLVRQGGWLLWDVPSQYGFGSVLAIAGFPGSGPWEAFYLLNALLNFLAAAAVFLVLRSLNGGALNLVFSLAAAASSVFFRSHMPGLISLEGPDAFPSTGGYRFFWCILLLGIVLLVHRAPSPGARGRWLLLGNLAWLVGVLWSAESAIYCSATWLPAHTLFVLLQRSEMSRGRLLGWLAVPALALGAGAAAITALYLRGLGHPPDVLMFIDYGRVYQAGFGAVGVGTGGNGWVLLLVLVILMTTALSLHGRAERSAMVVVVAASLAVWSTASYFVGRSVATNVWNLTAVVFMAIGLMLHVTRSHRGWGALARLAVAPLFVIVIAFTFGDQAGLGRYVADLQPRSPAHVEASLPAADPALVALMSDAGVGPTDPIVYFSPGPESTLLPETLGPSRHPMWLPVAPVDQFSILPAARRDVYVSRFRSRCGSGGWLVESLTVDPALSSVLHSEIAAGFRARASRSNRSWRVTRFEPLAAPGAGSCGRR